MTTKNLTSNSLQIDHTAPVTVSSTYVPTITTTSPSNSNIVISPNGTSLGTWTYNQGPTYSGWQPTRDMRDAPMAYKLLHHYATRGQWRDTFIWEAAVKMPRPIFKALRTMWAVYGTEDFYHLFRDWTAECVSY